MALELLIWRLQPRTSYLPISAGPTFADIVRYWKNTVSNIGRYRCATGVVAQLCKVKYLVKMSLLKDIVIQKLKSQNYDIWKLTGKLS